MAASSPSFDRYGSVLPASPVVLSVPHAGRDYPLALRAALRVPMAAVTILEDRHIDAVALAAHSGETMLIQRRARAWIDLNRSELERDPAIDEGAVWTALSQTSSKVRGGLGLVPRRVAIMGETLFYNPAPNNSVQRSNNDLTARWFGLDSVRLTARPAYEVGLGL